MPSSVGSGSAGAGAGAAPGAGAAGLGGAGAATEAEGWERAASVAGAVRVTTGSGRARRSGGRLGGSRRLGGSGGSATARAGWLGGAGDAGAAEPPARSAFSSRSIRASSAAVEGSTSGAAALISTSSSWIRAWAPLAVASSAAATRSSSRTTSAAGQRLGLSEQTLVALGGDAELLGNLLENLHGEQLARVDLQVAQDLARIAARAGEPCRGPQRLGGVAGQDSVDGLEQLLGVGHPEHREHVGGGDPLVSGVGHELLERAQRVPEAAGGVAGDQGHRARLDIDLLLGRPPGPEPGPPARPSGARSQSGGSGRPPWAAPSGPRWWRARRWCAAAAPRASSGRRSRPAEESMWASSRM